MAHKMLKPRTFPQFTKLAVELRVNIVRQSLKDDPPQLHYDGPELSRVEGPLPFCGPTSKTVDILKQSVTQSHAKTAICY